MVCPDAQCPLQLIHLDSLRRCNGVRANCPHRPKRSCRCCEAFSECIHCRVDRIFIGPVMVSDGSFSPSSTPDRRSKMWTEMSSRRPPTYSPHLEQVVY